MTGIGVLVPTRDVADHGRADCDLGPPVEMTGRAERMGFDSVWAPVASDMDSHTINPPPGWPTPPPGWSPPDGWKPDPNWPSMPDGWQLWLPDPEAPPTPIEPEVAFDSSATSDAPPVVVAPECPSPPRDQTTEGLRDEIKRLRSEVVQLRAAGGATADDLIDLDDERILQEVGVYNYHPLENAEAYKERLSDAPALRWGCRPSR